MKSSSSLAVDRRVIRTGGLAAMALLASLVAPVGSARAQLSVDRIEPGGGTRGTELEIALSGRELADPEQLWFENGAITVVSLTGVDDKRAKATIRIPADCPLGAHRLRLRTKQGLSDLRTFRVGQWPQTQEQEPNNDPATAPDASSPPPVGSARTIGGVIKGEDVDCFPVQARKGERIAVAIDAIRLDQEMFDPFLEIVDGRGFVLASCDDHPLLGQDAMLAVVAPEDGTYTVRVRESAYGGNDGCVYLLHVGRFPVTHVAWPPGGQPGQEIDVEWLGDPAGSFRSKVIVPSVADHDGLAEVRPAVDGIPTAAGVPLKISPHPAAVAQEPNDEPTQAATVTAPAAVMGRMDAVEDVDWIRVEAPKGSAWQVKGWGRRLGSPIDLVPGAAPRATLVALCGPAAEGETFQAAAIAALVPRSTSEAASQAVAFLVRARDAKARGAVFQAFLAAKGGAAALAAALDGSSARLPAAAVQEGRQAVSASGRPEPALEAALAAALARTSGLAVAVSAHAMSDAELEAFVTLVRTKADARRGAEIYARESLKCVSCHRIGDQGGRVGPNLSALGAASPLDYVIDSLLQPAKNVKEGYATLVVQTADGRVLTGIQVARSDEQLVLRDATGAEIRIPTADIDEESVGSSLMPVGLIDPLSRDELADLVRYLSELGR